MIMGVYSLLLVATYVGFLLWVFASLRFEVGLVCGCSFFAGVFV